MHSDAIEQCADIGTYLPPQWNIERGYKLDAVVAELQKIDADIIALQEVDVGCERSDSKDTGAPLAGCLLVTVSKTGTTCTRQMWTQWNPP